MNGQELNFQVYKDNQYSQWQKRILITDFMLSLVILGLECFSYITLLKHGERVTADFWYVFVRILCPAFLDFGSFFAAFQVCKNPKNSMFSKNLAVSINIFVICSVLAIFHNFFQFLLISSGFAFFVCSIFADKKILKILHILTIPVFLITVISYWFDTDTGTHAYKILSLVVAFAIDVFSFFFSRALIDSQDSQLSYIQKSYKTQTELIEELKIEPLTKLSNRVALNSAINRIIIHAENEDITPFMVMMDLDFFKSINDKYGHMAGDQVLTALSNIIKKNMGGTRQAFRYGGEEFVLIFENSMQTPVVQLVEAIRSDLANIHFDFAPELSIRISAGIAPFTARDGGKVWLENADKALYYAKEHGRDQIKIYDPSL